MRISNGDLCLITSKRTQMHSWTQSRHLQVKMRMKRRWLTLGPAWLPKEAKHSSLVVPRLSIDLITMKNKDRHGAIWVKCPPEATRAKNRFTNSPQGLDQRVAITPDRTLPPVVPPPDLIQIQAISIRTETRSSTDHTHLRCPINPIILNWKRLNRVVREMVSEMLWTVARVL